MCVCLRPHGCYIPSWFLKMEEVEHVDDVITRGFRWMDAQWVGNELCHPLNNTSALSESVLQNISVLNKVSNYSMCTIKKQITIC